MKILISTFLLVFMLSSCSRNPVNKLFDDMKKDDRVVALTLPGWMINKAFGLALMSEDLPNDEINKLQNVAGDLKKIRVCVNNKPSQLRRDALTKGIKKLDNRGYEVYAMARNENNSYSFHVQENKEIIKGLLFQINSKDNVALIYMEAEISKSTFEKMNLNFNKNAKKVSNENSK